jgi:dephospho-CoA kinase
MITIGITGTIGAGKGTIVDFLVKEKGFKHFSARAFLLAEINKRGMPETRDSMWAIAQEWRKNFSPGYMMEQLAIERKKWKGPAVIESQRAVGEIEVLRKELKGFILFAVDADPKIRYDRIIERKSSTDHVTFEKFVADEKKESSSTEAWSGNLPACKKLADYVFENDGTVEELHQKVDEILLKITP